MKIEKGMKVFITGAASGIGRATAIAMGRLGTKLFLTDRNAEGLDETVSIIRSEGGDVGMSRVLDISKYDEVKSFADSIHLEHGPMDIVMNIAGISVFALIEDMTHDHWEKVINVNLWGPIHGLECFVPEMIRAGKGGHVVNVSSVAGLTGAAWHGAYSTSKWGLVGVSEVLRYDLMQHGIGVTVVCPGAVETPLKQTVEIVNVDRDSAYVQAMMRRFSEHAVTPEKVASQIIRAIEKNKFMVLTSLDIKIVYFLKRKCFPLYHLIMKRISVMMNRARNKSP